MHSKRFVVFALVLALIALVGAGTPRIGGLLGNAKMTATLLFTNARVPLATPTSFLATGTTAPSGGKWEVWLDGFMVASDSNTAGWNVSLVGTTFTVTTAGLALAKSGYEVRHASSGGLSATFDIVPRVPAGGSAIIMIADNGEPPAGQLIWDITLGGNTVATSDVPNGWTAGLSSPVPRHLPLGSWHWQIHAPASAALGQNYKFRAQTLGSIYTLIFDVGISPVTSGITYPAWAESSLPLDGVAVGGHGPSAADSVNLSSGALRHMPKPDIVAANPIGPDASYRRIYLSTLAQGGTGYGGDAHGLAAGWNDGYGFAIEQATGKWTTLTLHHPNGAVEFFTPNTVNGVPDGTFSHPGGAPYVLTGVASGNTGVWNSLTLTMNDMTSWTFTPAALTDFLLLTGVKNVAGQSIHINRDGTDRITTVTNDASTALLTFAYDGSGFLSTVTDQNSRQVKYTFSTLYAVTTLAATSQVVPAGTTSPPVRWSYGYTENATVGSALTSVGAPDASNNGAIVSHPIVYDYANGRTISMTDADGNLHTYDYGQNTTQVNVTNADGSTALSWQQHFSNGVNTGFTDSASNTATLSYGDPVNPTKPTMMTDRSGSSETATWTPYGNFQTTTDFRGVDTTYTYLPTPECPTGLLQSVQVGTNQPTPRTATTYEYYPSGSGNATGRIYRIHQPRPNTSGTGDQVITDEYAYTAMGNVLTHKVLNQVGAQVSFQYGYTTDGAYSQAETDGEPITVSDPDGSTHTTHLRYDGNKRITVVIDAAGNETDYTYNQTGQVATITYPYVGPGTPSRAWTRFTYNGDSGDLVKTEDFDESGNNIPIRTLASRRGKESGMKGLAPGFIASQIARDAMGRVTDHYDANNNHTSTTHDPATGMLTSLTYALNDGQVFRYDVNGNKTYRRDGNGVETNYTLATDDKRVTDITYTSFPNENVHYGYDVYDRVTSIVDGTGETDYTYDDRDNVLTVTYHYIGLANPVTVTYVYNPDNSRASMQVSAIPGTFTYAYDNAGQLLTLTPAWGGGSVQYLYSNNGQVKRVTDFKTQAFISYNPRGKISQILNEGFDANGGDETLVSSYNSIRYDALGNLTSYSCNMPRIGAVADLSGNITLGYDNFQKIATESRTGTNLSYSVGFGRDNNANITLARLFGFGTPNADNQLTSGFGYDSNGNTLTHPFWTFQYDHQNRVTDVWYGGFHKLQQAWRGDGLRGWKNDLQGRTVYYIYDGSMPIAEVQPSGTVWQAYLYGANGMIQRLVGGLITSFTWDPMGSLASRHQHGSAAYASTMAVFDGLGRNLVDINVTNGSNHQTIDTIGFCTQWGMHADEQVKQSNAEYTPHLARHKYYDPYTCRYVSRDDVYGSPYVADGDDGKVVIGMFEFMSGLPLIGIPFAIDMGVSDIQEGNYGTGALTIGTALLSGIADELAISNSLREVRLLDAEAGLASSFREFDIASGSIDVTVQGDKYGLYMAKRADIDPDGFLDIVGHGNPEAMNAHGVPVSPTEMANIIRTSPQFTGQRVRLLSCDVGARPSGFAQKLADELGVVVRAPTDKVCVTPSGFHWVGAKDMSKMGEWLHFFPSKG